MKTLKEKVKSNERDSIDRLIRESKGDHLTIAKALATFLSHEGKLIKKYAAITDFCVTKTNFFFSALDLTTIFKAAIEERKKSEVDESKIKKELLHLFLTKLKKKNKKASWISGEDLGHATNIYFVI